MYVSVHGPAVPRSALLAWFHLSLMSRDPARRALLLGVAPQVLRCHCHHCWRGDSCTGTALTQRKSVLQLCGCCVRRAKWWASRSFFLEAGHRPSCHFLLTGDLPAVG